MTEALIALLSGSYAAVLTGESFLARRHRAALAHVVHVNGTRGKSTVCRLIDAGLRAGDFRVFTKTTGTLPMTIDVSGRETRIHRRGAANIREQLAMLRLAALDRAEVLVVECMAVEPALQYVSQHRMLKADVGVITNVRLDHTDVMGPTLDSVCDSLANTIPERGALFTADRAFFSRLEKQAQRLGTTAALAEPDAGLPDFDFPENLALALAVCEHLGVGRETALSGMRVFRRDPFALSVHALLGGVFINGLSINDPQSTVMVYRMLEKRFSLAGRRLILLINTRDDRGFRTEQMLAVASALAPDEIWLAGASLDYLCRKLPEACGRELPVRVFRELSTAPALPIRPEEVVFAIGNVAGAGAALMEWVRANSTGLWESGSNVQ